MHMQGLRALQAAPGSHHRRCCSARPCRAGAEHGRPGSGSASAGASSHCRRRGRTPSGLPRCLALHRSTCHKSCPRCLPPAFIVKEAHYGRGTSCPPPLLVVLRSGGQGRGRESGIENLGTAPEDRRPRYYCNSTHMHLQHFPNLPFWLGSCCSCSVVHPASLDTCPSPRSASMPAVHDRVL